MSTSFLASIDTQLTNREKSVLLRRWALHGKYEKAVDLYADTDMTLKEIANECNVSVGGLSRYLCRYWRELVLRRHRIQVEGENAKDVKIVQVGKQNVNAHAKYKDAVAACDSLDYIDLNVSQVARKFNLDGTALANFMRIHYSETLVWREKVRQRLGINDNVWHGARPECTKQYAEAVELYRNTDMTISQIAEQCQVSTSGFSQHLRFYHKEILKQKRQKRKSAETERQRTLGEMTGNGRTYRPSPATEQKYAVALALYKDTTLTMKKIVEQTGVPAGGFRSYLHLWHRDLVLERSGIADGEQPKDLRSARKRMKTVAAKYEKAIDSLRANPRPASKVAAEFGFNPEVFREYLHKHEPELIQRRGTKKVRPTEKTYNQYPNKQDSCYTSVQS